MLWAFQTRARPTSMVENGTCCGAPTANPNRCEYKMAEPALRLACALRALRRKTLCVCNARRPVSQQVSQQASQQQSQIQVLAYFLRKCLLRDRPEGDNNSNCLDAASAKK